MPVRAFCSSLHNIADHSAVIHYKAPEQGSAIIDINQVYLCDSGAQYLDGQSRCLPNYSEMLTGIRYDRHDTYTSQSISM